MYRKNAPGGGPGRKSTRSHFTPLWPQVCDRLAATSEANARRLAKPCPPGRWVGGLHSPLREDKNPSFSAIPDDVNDPGGWKDHATGDHGSMADLAERLSIDPRVSGPKDVYRQKRQPVRRRERLFGRRRR